MILITRLTEATKLMLARVRRGHRPGADLLRAAGEHRRQQDSCAEPEGDCVRRARTVRRNPVAITTITPLGNNNAIDFNDPL